MLDNPEQIAGFGRYQAAGGFKKPSSYGVSNTNQSAAQALSGPLRETINSELDYRRDGVQGLPQIITELAAKCDSAVSANKAWNDYLDIAAKPDDLMQVSIGVDVLCKQAGTPNDKPAASTIPITDGSLVDASKQAIDAAKSKKSEVIALMAELNTALTPTVTSGMGGSEVVTPPPPLPAKLKSKALDMVTTLRPMAAAIGSSSSKVSGAASKATSERSNALKAFNDAVAFTIIANGAQNPVIKDAINAINPV